MDFIANQLFAMYSSQMPQTNVKLTTQTKEATQSFEQTIGQVSSSKTPQNISNTRDEAKKIKQNKKANQEDLVKTNETDKKQKVKNKQEETKTKEKINTKEDIKTEETKISDVAKTEKTDSSLDTKLSKEISEILDEESIKEQLEALLQSGDSEAIKEMLPIISTLMQQLGVTFEEIKVTLQEMGIDSTALADPEQFKDFVSRLLDADTTQLLTDDPRVKDLGKLLEQIQKITENVTLNGKQIILEKILLDNQVVDQNKQVVDIQQGPNSVPIETQISAQPLAEAKMNKLQNTQTTEISSLDKGTVLSQEPNASFGFGMLVEAMDESAKMNLTHQGSQSASSSVNYKNIDIAKQIIDKVEIKQLEQGNAIEMQLSPKELGKLVLKLTEHQGLVTASIKVESEKTKEVIMQNIDQLKESLAKQGLTVGGFEVDVQKDSSQTAMEQQKQKSSKRIEEILNRADLLEEEQEEENLLDAMQETEINYKA